MLQKDMTQGEMIRDARTKKGITQKQLADKLGVSETYLSQYERDLRKPKVETLQKIAAALEMDILSIADFDTAFALVANDINRLESDYGEYFFPLMAAFQSLNEEGQRQAVDRIKELAEIPKYQEQNR